MARTGEVGGQGVHVKFGEMRLDGMGCSSKK
jgi:hypothetical protein